MPIVDSVLCFVLTEAFALVLLAFVFRRPLLEEKRNLRLKILLVMLALYLGQLFYVLLSPTYFFRRFAFSTERLNLVPFRALREWLAHPLNFFGNVVLFMPIGFFGVLLHPERSRKRQLASSAGAAAAISLFVEFAQLFNYRVSDVDDVILNTLGGAAGALLCMLQQRIGFDRTRVGRFLLPRIPVTWRRHMLLNRFCAILVVTMEVFLFAVNYAVTVPRPAVRANTAAQPGSQATQSSRVYDTADLALEARSVLLVRLDGTPDGEVIYAVDSAKQIYPASTLKMVTALTVLEIAGPDEPVRLGSEIYLPPLDASRAGLEYGMTLTVRDLLKGLLLPSGADAAYALGVYCGRKLEGDTRLDARDAIRSFVAAMNRKAQAVGASHTTAVNVAGLDDREQTTTCEDVLKIARAFLDDPVLAEICGLPVARITSGEGKSVALKNTNKMLLEDSAYYNGAVAGVKTGTTSRAGNCLVSVFTVEGERYLCIVMNSSYDGRFTDTQKLYELCAAAQAAPAR